MDGTRIRRGALELKFKETTPGEGQEQPGTAAHEEVKEMWGEGSDCKLFVGRPVWDEDDDRRRGGRGRKV